MLGNKTDFLDEMLRDYDVVDHGNGSLTFNGVLYTIPPEMYTNTTGEALPLPADVNSSESNLTMDFVEQFGVTNITYEDFIGNLTQQVLVNVSRAGNETTLNTTDTWVVNETT